jgi:8-oxo-dGTP diphosphatase
MLNCNRRHIHVTCGIIEQDGLVLAAQRSAVMSMPLKWEFPGGKIKSGESLEDCLHRELVEELSVEIVISQPLPPTTYEYPSCTVSLYPFICSIAAGEIKLNEHAAVTWLLPGELYVLDWAEADLPVLAIYCQQLEKVRS